MDPAATASVLAEEAAARAPTPIQLYVVLMNMLQRHDRQVQYADRKSASIFVLVGVLLSLLTSQAVPALADVFDAVRHAPSASEVLRFVVVTIASFVFAAAGLWTVLNLVWAINPRVSVRQERGHYFFGDIVSYDLDTWRRHMLTVNPEDLYRDMIEQVYTTAKIIGIKYRYIGRAVRGLIVMIPAGIVVYIGTLL